MAGIGGGEGTGYMSEPQTYGKVILITTFGNIDVELWSREAPLACRNFVQLCLEGYYNGCEFFRVIKNFIAQSGDPTNTGQGGESIYPEGTFKDEFHSRIRFNRRGLLAMAGEGDLTNSNKSQFFFTMGPTQQLQKKNTLFGKVTGDTLFNLLKLNDMEVDANDRPYSCHRILQTEILLNPFPDINPRIKKKVVKKEKKKKVKKNASLLSFEEDEAGLEASSLDQVLKKKGKGAHDLLEDSNLIKGEQSPAFRQVIEGDAEVDDQANGENPEKEESKASFDGSSEPSSSRSVSPPEEAVSETVSAAETTRSKLRKSKDSGGTAADKIRSKLKEHSMNEDGADVFSKAKQAKRKVLADEAMQLAKEIKGLGARADQRKDLQAQKDEKRKRTASKAFVITEVEGDDIVSEVERKRREFKARMKRTKDREGDTLAKLASFKTKMTSIPDSEVQGQESDNSDDDGLDEEERAVKRDLKSGNWMNHKIKFSRRPQDYDHMARDHEKYEYAVFDPRDIKGLKHDLPPRPSERRRRDDSSRSRHGRK